VDSDPKYFQGRDPTKNIPDRVPNTVAINEINGMGNGVLTRPHVTNFMHEML
jgi:hypothetical protein